MSVLLSSTERKYILFIINDLVSFGEENNYETEQIRHFR